MIRKEAWIVSYAAPHATLELHFISPAPEWRLFVTADSNVRSLTPCYKGSLADWARIE